MNRLAHHGSRHLVDVESDFAHARHIVVPALLWAVAIVAIVVVAALQDLPSSGAEPAALPAAVPVAPLGA